MNFGIFYVSFAQYIYFFFVSTHINVNSSYSYFAAWWLKEFDNNVATGDERRKGKERKPRQKKQKSCRISFSPAALQHVFERVAFGGSFY